MLKHIVFWTLKDFAEGASAQENAVELKTRLESLVGVVPGLMHAEVGIDLSRGEASADVALYSEFENAGALAAYQIHPDHQAVVAFLGPRRDARMVVDYEV